MKLLALDIDQTLAPVGEPIAETTLELLRAIAATGVRLMLVSGKPVEYVAGLARQAGLGSVIVSGDNGATTWASADFPPAWDEDVAVSPVTLEALNDVRRRVVEEFGGRIWLQPSRANLAVFWRSDTDAPGVLAFLSGAVSASGLDAAVHAHPDAAEVVPVGATKAEALGIVMRRTGIGASEVAAVGDSQNDATMLALAGTSVGVGDVAAEHRFGAIDDALRWIIGGLLTKEGD